MYLLAILKGIFAGFLISLPTGPAAFLTIKRTISSGFKTGMVSALGCMASDMAYGSVVIFGLSSIALFMLHWQQHIRFAGGILLLYVGITTYHSIKRQDWGKKILGNKNFGDFASAFFLTVTNPIQILTFAIVFGSVGAISGSHLMSSLFIGGLLFGALLWWIITNAFISKYARHWSEHTQTIINKIAGAVISITGVVALVSVICYFINTHWR